MAPEEHRELPGRGAVSYDDMWAEFQFRRLNMTDQECLNVWLSRPVVLPQAQHVPDVQATRHGHDEEGVNFDIFGSQKCIWPLECVIVHHLCL